MKITFNSVILSAVLLVLAVAGLTEVPGGELPTGTEGKQEQLGDLLDLSEREIKELIDAGYLKDPSNSPKKDQAKISASPVATVDPSIPPLPDNFRKSFEVLPIPKIPGHLAIEVDVFGVSRIVAFDPSLKKIRVLVNGPGDNSSQSWSTDGRALTFSSTRSGKKEIYVSSWDGSSPRRVTNSAQPADQPSWSVDGERIIFTALKLSDSGKLLKSNFMSINVDGTRPVALTRFSEKNLTPSWAPNERSILYSTSRNWPGWDVCYYRLSLNKETCFLTGRRDYTRPRWNRKGNAILFNVGSVKDSDIGIYSFSTKKQSMVKRGPSRSFGGDWGPSDRYLVFIDEDRAEQQYQVFLYDSEGDHLYPMLKSKFRLRSVSWNPRTAFELESLRVQEK